MQVRIKAPNPYFIGKRNCNMGQFTKNAGPILTVTFYDGLSEPVDEKFALEFCKHFPKYGIVPLDDVVEDVQPLTLSIKFLQEHKHGKKIYAVGETATFKEDFAKSLIEKRIAEHDTNAASQE